jgi:predicted dienelactone hydrolase
MIVRWVAALAAVSIWFAGLALAEAPAGAVDLKLTDSARERTLPVRIVLPAASGPAPVVLYSHGLGGNLDVAGYLVTHWRDAGYAVVVLQHPGSDDAVWRDKRRGQAIRAMKKAASAQNLILRFEDVSFVMDELERMNAGDARFAGRFDLGRIAMTGHSFGAHTSQGVGGQSLNLVGTRYTDTRIKAVIAFSPSSGNKRSPPPEEQFGGVRIPWLLMTGTEDSAAIGNETVESRLRVFPALPPGSKYELVLDGAAHLAFTDRDLGERAAPRDPDHHPDIQEISTAFLDAYLKGDVTARAWLDGDGPRSILDPEDRWQVK